MMKLTSKLPAGFVSIDLEYHKVAHIRNKYPNAIISSYDGEIMLDFNHSVFAKEAQIEIVYNYYSFWLFPITESFVYQNKKHNFPIYPFDREKIDLFYISEQNRLYLYKEFHKLSSALLERAEDKVIECLEKNPHIKLNKKTKLTPRLAKLLNFM